MKTKYPFLIWVILLIGTCSYAQTPPSRTTNAAIDSLRTLIDSHKNGDPEKVIQLNEYARLCFHTMNFLDGLVATKEARDLSAQLNFAGGKIMYYLTLAAYFGNGPMYAYYNKEAQWLALKSDKESARYYVVVNLHEYNWGRDFDAVAEQFSKMLEQFKSPDDKELRAVILYRISNFKFMQNSIGESLTISDESKKLYSDLGQSYPIFLSSIRKMNIFVADGRTADAKRIETELIEFIARNKDSNAIGLITSTMANGFAQQERYALALEYYLKSLEVFDEKEDLEMRAETYQQMGIAYENIGMNSKASESYRNYLSAMQTLNDSSTLFLAYDIMVSPLIALKNYDEARKYMALALRDTISENRTYILARYNDAEGQILRDQGRYEEAIVYFKKAFNDFAQNTNSSSQWGAPFMPLYIARCYLKLGKNSQALDYANQCMALEKALPLMRTNMHSDVTLLLSEIYERLGNNQKAFEYLKAHQKIKYESDRLDEVNRIADAETRALIDKSQEEIGQLEKDRVDKEQQNRIQRLWIFSISGALLSAIVLAVVLYRNNKNKQQANALLSEQKEEIQSTLERLEATQSQLIQSEKMASLGELTAGIAHEIQNPLNFINNFSEINSELLSEMKGEIEKGNLENVTSLAGTVIGNEEKINQHGKRADSIVKGMLQHSRTSSGVKELTNINTLTDEYLRLAYHGFRAKNKTINVTLNNNFDQGAPVIKIVPQEIGRVILNILNNAFYAVSAKAQATGNDTYNPTVSVTTKKTTTAVLISIKDNADGIPKELVSKIFQPFFTTKPTGQGTGLGLSLSYDIVKAHGGELKVETKEGEGSEFVIQLPVF